MTAADRFRAGRKPGPFFVEGVHNCPDRSPRTGPPSVGPPFGVRVEPVPRGIVDAVKTKAQSRHQLAAIRRARGAPKCPGGDRPPAEEWAEHTRAELALEEAKFVRCTGGAR